MSNTPGTPVTFGKYKLISLLGEGGMAKVYRAVISGPMGFEKEVAVKKIDRHLTQDDRFVKALINEARLGGQLRHKNIVEVYDFDQVDGDYYLAMEFVDGWTLDTILKECRRQDPPRFLPPLVVVDMAVQICRGLEFAHSLRDKDGQEMHLVHRDLKPANLIVARNGDVKIMDFGIAKADSNLYKTTAADVTKGTPIYMSPEQVRGESLSSRSDLFSLGSILHELTTLRIVFSGDQLLTIMHKVLQADVSDAVDRVESRLPGMGAILVKAMAKKPEERYGDASEVEEDLLRLRAERVRAGETGPTLVEYLREFEVWGRPRPSVRSPSSQSDMSVAPMVTGTQSMESTREGGSSELGSFTRAFLETGNTEPRSTGPVSIGPTRGLPPRPENLSPTRNVGASTTAREFYDTSAADARGTSADLGTTAGQTRQKALVAGAVLAILVLVLSIGYLALRPKPPVAGPVEPPPTSATAPTDPQGVVPPPVVPLDIEVGPAPKEGTAGVTQPTGAEDPAAREAAALAAKEKAAREKAARDREAKEKAARERAERERLALLEANDKPVDPLPEKKPDPPPPAGKANLWVNSKPWANIYLDGQHIGNTPRKNYEIPSGSHTLKLICGACPSGVAKEKVITFTAEPGGTVRYTDIHFQ